MTDPIFNNLGQEADHKTVFVQTRIPRVLSYVKQIYQYVQRTPEDDQQLAQYIRNHDWTTVSRPATSDLMVNELHRVIKQGISQAY